MPTQPNMAHDFQNERQFPWTPGGPSHGGPFPGFPSGPSGGGNFPGSPGGPNQPANPGQSAQPPSSPPPNFTPQQAQIQPFAVDAGDRKSTRLNSSHVAISYAVFCLKKKIISKILTRLILAYVAYH